MSDITALQELDESDQRRKYLEDLEIDVVGAQIWASTWDLTYAPPIRKPR